MGKGGTCQCGKNKKRKMWGRKEGFLSSKQQRISHDKNHNKNITYHAINSLQEKGGGFKSDHGFLQRLIEDGGKSNQRR